MSVVRENTRSRDVDPYFFPMSEFVNCSSESLKSSCLLFLSCDPEEGKCLFKRHEDFNDSDEQFTNSDIGKK